MEMERVSAINTEFGNILGRDAIYLDQILFKSENELTLFIELNINDFEKKVKIEFKGILFVSIVELDFDNRNILESLAVIENSIKINEFKIKNHSSKINDKHKHYYIRTYDTVFEIIADYFNLISTL